MITSELTSQKRVERVSALREHDSSAKRCQEKLESFFVRGENKR